MLLEEVLVGHVVVLLVHRLLLRADLSERRCALQPELLRLRAEASELTGLTQLLRARRAIQTSNRGA